jgi:pyruvate,water dikinase
MPARPVAGDDGSMTSTPAQTADLERAVRLLSDLRRDDVAVAGGKGANLGELVSAGFPVPPGLVVGAPAYGAFCDAGGLRDRLAALLDGVDVDDTARLEAAAARARELVMTEPLAPALERVLRDRIEAVTEGGRVPVAVRSSATAEDTESASFAGMHESFLNVVGTDAALDAVRRCWASLFGPRSVFYRAKRGFGLADVDIAVVVQRQVAATRAGVMFSVDPASGDPSRIVIEASFGLGEAVVSGSVSPDRYVVDKASLEVVAREVRAKELVVERADGGGVARRPATEEERRRPALSEQEIRDVADLGRRVEEHYGAPQDMEWAYDPEGRLWLLQSRPVTTAARPPEADRPGAELARGLGAAPGMASGPVRRVRDLGEAARVRDGDVLVTHMTAPDWVPLMRRAAAIVTESGGMTCHAAIVARELGIPCVVGTGDATRTLRDGELVTVDATQGTVRAGGMPAVREEAGRGPAGAPAAAAAPAAPMRPVTATRLLVNLSQPSQLDRVRDLDVDGVGLLRAELMLLEALDGAHPHALIEEGRGDEVAARMAESITAFAAAFSPRPVTYRTIDFRTNEFRGLRGGDRFEPVEANPMIGLRGAVRYTRDPEVFRLELDALARVWNAGYENVHVMLPFVRTERELRRCLELIAASGLSARPRFGVWIMAEVPSVLFNLERYARLGIVGISIGSNDLTQLLLGADRDSEALSDVFDERDPAVLDYLRRLIPAARAAGLQTSICGQAPSVHPEYADLLVRAGIDAVSVTPDAVDRTRRLIAAAEQRLWLEAARAPGGGAGGPGAGRDRA